MHRESGPGGFTLSGLINTITQAKDEVLGDLANGLGALNAEKSASAQAAVTIAWRSAHCRDKRQARSSSPHGWRSSSTAIPHLQNRQVCGRFRFRYGVHYRGQ